MSRIIPMGDDPMNGPARVRHMDAPRYRLKSRLHVEGGEVSGLDPIGNKVVGAYFKIQNGVVGAYKKIETAFIDRFLEPIEDGTNKR